MSVVINPTTLVKQYTETIKLICKKQVNLVKNKIG